MVSGTPRVPEEQVDEIEDSRLYDEALAYLDAKLGQLFQCLADNGLLDETLVVVTPPTTASNSTITSCGTTASRSTSRSCGFPSWCATRSECPAGEEPRLVQNHDVFSTALEVADVDWQRTPAHNCQSLLKIAPEPRLAVAEHLDPYYDQLAELAKNCPQVNCSKAFRRLRAVRRENYKLILSSTEEPELYDLQRDPLELANLAAKQPEVVQDLRGQLDRWLASFPAVRVPGRRAHEDVHAQTTEEHSFIQGRGLGYVR